MQIGNIDINKARGFGDKVIGLGREFWGHAFDNERMVEAGEAQQAKGTERIKALKAEAKAEKHEAKAELHEQHQKAAERAKQRAS